jgi:nitrile hydratase accessory protein
MPDNAALPALLRDEGGPVFAEPWQAHAFALAVKLSEAGAFTWSEWAAALGAELAAASERGEPDDGSRYYHHWLAALERLVAARDIATGRSLIARKEEWAEAYRRTPHGHPVVLQHAETAPHSSPLPASGEREGPAPGLHDVSTAELSASTAAAEGSPGAAGG